MSTLFFDHLFFTETGFGFWANIFLYFAFMSILGWIIEMVYLSTAKRGLINSGFLQGPFCPAYGAGATLMYPIIFIGSGFPIWAQLLFYAFVCTVVEYTAHFALEKILGIRIWDYTDEPLNINGRVSLKYSVFWLFLMAGLIILFQPGTVFIIESIPTVMRNILFGLFVAIFLFDYIYSLRLFKRLSSTIEDLLNKLKLKNKSSLHDLQFNRPRIMKEKKRIKRLMKDPEYVALEQKIENKVLVDEIFEKDPEFLAAIRDLIENPKFIDWKNSSEKARETCIRHLRIAELSWRFCTTMEFDRVTAARGALVCAYKRCNPTPQGKAANKLFPQTSAYLWVKHDLKIDNKTERDVILFYKWPINFKAPDTKEALMVSFADKIMKCREFRLTVAELYASVLSE